MEKTWIRKSGYQVTGYQNIRNDLRVLLKIRTTIFQLLVFCACFLKQLIVIYLFVICYETFLKKNFWAFVFRRSPLFAAFTKS